MSRPCSVNDAPGVPCEEPGKYTVAYRICHGRMLRLHVCRLHRDILRGPKSQYTVLGR